ncbi:hypothetical protein NUU18_04185 [Pediococcus pentosaceus]|uniref:hypothetical protein n=1 Tax=Pediococcus pentosaceus TaxID=1255 RepID=UPI0021E9053B|nr:hypothetical protein [Pediococcus pentosaceus]MCV3325578.1 hypothetical protein [Pediococcus pentosaceus]
MENEGLNSNQTNSFLGSLSYWKAINLRMTLIKAQYNQSKFGINDENAYKQALLEYDDKAQLKYDFERALKSGI